MSRVTPFSSSWLFGAAREAAAAHREILVGRFSSSRGKRLHHVRGVDFLVILARETSNSTDGEQPRTLAVTGALVGGSARPQRGGNGGSLTGPTDGCKRRFECDTSKRERLSIRERKREESSSSSSLYNQQHPALSLSLCVFVSCGRTTALLLHVGERCACPREAVRSSCYLETWT